MPSKWFEALPFPKFTCKSLDLHSVEKHPTPPPPPKKNKSCQYECVIWLTTTPRPHPWKWTAGSPQNHPFLNRKKKSSEPNHHFQVPCQSSRVYPFLVSGHFPGIKKPNRSLHPRRTRFRWMTFQISNPKSRSDLTVMTLWWEEMVSFIYIYIHKYVYKVVAFQNIFFLIFSPQNWGKWADLTNIIYFSDGLVQPPTSYSYFQQNILFEKAKGSTTIFDYIFTVKTHHNLSQKTKHRGFVVNFSGRNL